MKIDVYLRNTQTGDMGVYHDSHDWLDEPDYPASDAITYIYGEGNYSCDCNRALFLYDWSIYAKQIQCGHGLISIDKITNRETGEIIYRDETS